MTATVITLDYASGSASESTSGRETTRVALVSVDDSVQPHDILGTALTAPAIPSIGDAHPSSIFSNQVCIGKTVSVVGENRPLDFFVRCTYAKPTIEEWPGAFPDGQLYVNGVNITENRVRDINDANMIVTYSGADPSFPAPVTRAINAQVIVGRLSVQVVRIEATQPFAQARDNISFVNQAGWKNYPEKTWRINAIRSAPTLRNNYFRNVWDLSYNPDTWRRRGTIYGLPGVFPTDSTPGNGFQDFDVYVPVDFNALPLNIIPALP